MSVGDRGPPTDLEWYLKQQVHPPVARLCEPIEGTDAAQIASCLGLDPTKFSHGSSAGDAQPGGERVKTLTSQMTDAQRFADATPLKLLCTACSVRSPVAGLFHKGSVTYCTRTHGPDDVKLTRPKAWTLLWAHPQNAVVMVCPNPACKLPMLSYSVAAQVNAAIRDDLQRYYDGWVVRADRLCSRRRL